MTDCSCGMHEHHVSTTSVVNSWSWSSVYMRWGQGLNLTSLHPPARRNVSSTREYRHETYYRYFSLLHDLSSPFLPFETGDHHQYPPEQAPGPPLSAPNQESRGISDHVDGSGPIFSLYLEMASEEDKKMAESWKDDADGILIFVRRYRLFP